MSEVNPADPKPAWDVIHPEKHFPPPTSKSEIFRYATAVVMVGTVFFSAAIKQRLYQDRASCSAPSPAAVAATTRLIKQWPHSSKLSAAKEFGLHVVKERPAVEDLEVGADTVSDVDLIQNPRQEVEIAANYLDEFGLKLQVGADRSIDGLESPTTNQLRTDLRDDLGEITWDIQFLPTEYIHLTGLKKIILMDSSTSPIAFESIDNNSTLVWNIAGQPENEEINEAFSIAVDYMECYNPAHDNAYNALNPVKNIYGPAKNHRGYTALDTPRPKEDYLRGDQAAKAFEEGEVTGDYTKYCTIENDFAFEQRRIVMANGQSFDNLQADKEWVGAMLQWPYNNYNDLLDPHSPVLAAKAKFLLARLYQRDPRLAKYFLAISGRYDDGLIDCAKVA